MAHTEILCFNLRFVGYWPAHASRTRLYRLEADVKTTLFNLEDLMTEICVNTEYAVVENEMYVKVLH